MKESKVAKGRIGVYLPTHPGANNRGYVLRYRVVVEEYLGRLLENGEQVHHCDGDKTNDIIENLELVLVGEHARHHFDEKPNFGKRKLDYDAIVNLRKQKLGYKKIAKILNYSPNSVQSAVRKIEKGHF